MYHSKKKQLRSWMIITLILSTALLSFFTSVDPVDANALSSYPVFSLDEVSGEPLRYVPASAPPVFSRMSGDFFFEVVAAEAAVSPETISAKQDEVRAILDEIARKKAEEEARKKAEEEARRKAEEEARKKAEEEARKKAEEEAKKEAELKAEAEAAGRRVIDYTLQEVNGYSELEYLAAICFIEAGNNYDGSLAVANVIINRMLSSKYPDTLYDVIYQKNQFATRRVNSLLTRGPYSRCLQAAQDALAGVNNIGNRMSFRANGQLSDEKLSTLDYVVVGGNTFF